MTLFSSLQTFWHAAGSASQRQVAVQWRQGWPPEYYQWPTGGPLVVMRTLGTEATSHHSPASHMRPEADSEVGSVVACHWQAAGRPPCKSTLSHPVGEGRLADQGWLATGGPPAGRWCYVCRVVTRIDYEVHFITCPFRPLGSMDQCREEENKRLQSPGLVTQQ